MTSLHNFAQFSSSIISKSLVFLALILSFSAYAQIEHGGTPVSFIKTLNTTAVYVTPVLNTQALINEDKVTDLHKDIAWRFGVEQFINLNLNNSGTWTILPNGDKVWRLKIVSPNARSINFNYSAFNLPIGATFFVYNKNKVLGSFTHKNNKSTSEFSTSLLKGDYAILEYFEPLSVQGQGVINISSIVHGYRDLFNQLKLFGQSGSCNINSICDDADWGNENRSGVMLLTAGNTRFCSGALINNVLQDSTPYVLTANHCSPSTSSIFMFNYKSPNCVPNTDGPTTQTVSGCTIRASDSPSDFFLVELSSIPPSTYNAFFAGWSKINTPATSATGIHQPRGDVQKISHDTDPLIESGYYVSGNDHWEVLDWNSGTTEGGSSGSPLFDQNHRIVGQLHGGNAACGNDAFDYYGKFSVSWDADPSSTKQLKFWLDPNNTGVTTLNGFDPNGAAVMTDAFLMGVSGIPSSICGDSISPVINVRNHGSNNLSSFDISYSLDGGTISVINWTGNIAPFGVTSINLPTIYIGNGSHVFTSSISNPNGTTDQNLTNNNSSTSFSSIEFPAFATFDLKTDNWGSELSWVVRDNSSGNTISQGGGYPNINGGQTYSESLCLYKGCFTLTLYDAAATPDGYCCGFGSGSSLITNSSGDTLAFDDTFNNDSINFTFCLDTTTGINEYMPDAFSIYPNPTNGIFIIDRNQNTPVEIIVYDVLGKVIYQKKNEISKKISVDLTNKTQGVYFVSLISKNEKAVKRIVIN